MASRTVYHWARQCLCVATLIAAVFAIPLAAQEKLPTAEEVIARSLAARGGIEKLKALNTMKFSGRAVIAGGQLEASLTVLMKRPNMIRIEMAYEGKSFIQAYDGVTAWSLNPFTGATEPQKAGSDETSAMQYSADIEGPFVDYQRKGNSIELAGKDDVDGASAYKIKLTRKNGAVEYHWFDTVKYLPLKTVATRRQAGNDVEIESHPSNFKTVDGVLVPFSIEQKANGRPMVQMTLEKVELNIPVEDAPFRMPVKEEKK